MASDASTETYQTVAPPSDQGIMNGNTPVEQTSVTTNGPMNHASENRITLPPVSLPSFFEESIDVLPVSPSPNGSITQSQLDLLAALREEPITSTPYANHHDANPPMLDGADPNQSFSTPNKSLKDRLLEAEEREGPLGNVQPTIRSPLDKYTKALMPPIHYSHPTAILDHLDVNLVGDWENLPKGKLLAQPFGPDARSIDKHPHLKALLFAAVVEITDSHDVSVCAPKAKANSYRTPFSFLIYNITEQQAQTLLQRHVWSSTAISFSVSTFNPPCPAYLFSLKGLTTMDNDEVSNAVKKVWNDSASRMFLQSICLNHPVSLQNQISLILQKFIDTLKIDRLDTKLRGNTIAPIFNIYANGSLIGDDSTWSQIRSYYATRTYALQAQDPAITVIAPFKCGICHAADHPRGLCPFPTIDGWNGPKRRDPVFGGSGGAGPGPDNQK